MSSCSGAVLVCKVIGFMMRSCPLASLTFSKVHWNPSGRPCCFNQLKPCPNTLTHRLQGHQPMLSKLSAWFSFFNILLLACLAGVPVRHHLYPSHHWLQCCCSGGGSCGTRLRRCDSSVAGRALCVLCVKEVECPLSSRPDPFGRSFSRLHQPVSSQWQLWLQRPGYWFSMSLKLGIPVLVVHVPRGLE